MPEPGQGVRSESVEGIGSVSYAPAEETQRAIDALTAPYRVFA